MTKRMCVEFLKYRWFPILVVVMGFQLLLAYLTMHNPGVSPVDMLRLCCYAMGFAGNYLGYYIHQYLAKPHVSLVPGFRKAHIGFALSLNCVFAMLETGVMIAGPWPDISYINVFVILWAFGSIWLWITRIGLASWFVGTALDLFWLFCPLLWSAPLLPPFLGFFYNTAAAKTAFLLVGALTLNMLLGARTLTAGKDRRWLSPAEVTRRWMASPGPIARTLLWNRMLHALDAIPHPVAGNFFSHVRLFRLSRLLLPHVVLIGMFLGGLCLGQYQAGKQQLEVADTTLLWGLYAALIPLVQFGILGNGRENFRLVFRLPLRRQDAIVRYGASALVLALEVWTTFIAAAGIGALLPFGFGLKAFPSLRFLITSFSVHLAVFGITAFLSTLQIGTAGQVTLALLLIGAFGVTALVVPVSFVPLASIFLAMALLWASYSLLCNAEID